MEPATSTRALLSGRLHLGAFCGRWWPRGRERCQICPSPRWSRSPGPRRRTRVYAATCLDGSYPALHAVVQEGSGRPYTGLDTFVAVPRDSRLFIRWPDTTLELAEQDTLTRVLANLNTLGRSESWCEASLATEEVPFEGMTCRPLKGDIPQDHEIIRLLCADQDHAFRDDHVVSVTRKTEGRGKNKRSIEQRSTVYDPAWNLCMETLQLQKERWSDPPGSRWVRYARSLECFKIAPKPKMQIIGARGCIQVVRYALDSSVLPLVTETLPVAEAARRSLMGIYGRRNPSADGQKGRSAVLAGKDEQGNRLSGHGHAYYLPTGRGRGRSARPPDRLLA